MKHLNWVAALLLILGATWPARGDIIESVTEDIVEAKARDIGKGGGECQSLTNVSAPDAPVRAGKVAFRHFVLHCGERSELSMGRTKIGETYWYGWSLFFPSELQSGGIAAQWATYPTQRDFRRPNGGGAVGTYMTVSGDDLIFRFQHQGKEKDIQFAPYPLAKMDDIKGQWVDFVMHVKWTGNDDGFLRFWMKAGQGSYGEPKINYTGATFWNDEVTGPYFKMGRYNGDPGWKGEEPGIWYSDEYRLGDARATFNDVAPPGTVVPYVPPQAAPNPPVAPQ